MVGTPPPQFPGVGSAFRIIGDVEDLRLRLDRCHVGSPAPGGKDGGGERGRPRSATPATPSTPTPAAEAAPGWRDVDWEWIRKTWGALYGPNKAAELFQLAVRTNMAAPG